MKLFLIPMALIGALSAAFFLPKAGKVAESAICMTLPESLESWHLKFIQPSKKEYDILAKDTEFSKAVCFNDNGEGTTIASDGIKRIDLSIVLSGSDINSSIHRPERCMPAQGHQIYGMRSESLSTPSGKKFPIRELTSTQTVLPKDDQKQQPITLHALTLYFFVGNHTITENHLNRTFIDMVDRVAYGRDQRWAYVSVSMWFSENNQYNLPSREVAEKELRKFLANLAEKNINWDQIKP